MTNAGEEPDRALHVCPGWLQVLAWGGAVAVCLPLEGQRLKLSLESGVGPVLWLTDWNIDTTLPLILLLFAPLCRLMRGRWRGPAGRMATWLARGFTSAQGATRTRRIDVIAWGLSGVVGMTSLGVSAWVASRPVTPPADGPAFGSLPPAYHDEYSYLFQARTFLAGRTWYPSHAEIPELFQQMHVLNEGRMASRYFPATGLWIAPFLAADQPHIGHWIAGALTAVFIFWSARELAGNNAGFLAGSLTALSPGMGIFSNLLLAHHPTLLGLSAFLFCFLRMMRTRSRRAALCSGIALAFAMLARPMTAAGFGLPFGLWLFWWLLRGDRDQPTVGLRNRIPLVVTLAIPLAIALVGLFFLNRSITGDGLTTPYERYLDLHTPRHVYGFNNVVRGEQRLGPHVIEKYDRWAENLTPALAARNVRNRFVASLRWTLGIVPITASLIVLAGRFTSLSLRARLTLLTIVSLHLAHVPYWYDGILHWHYVFETGPILAIAVALATGLLVSTWMQEQRRALAVWWLSLLAAIAVMNLVDCEPLWSTSRVSTAVNNTGFSRRRYAEFRRLIEQRVPEGPALILIEHDPYDRHIDYVTNEPTLHGNVLFGRYRSGTTDLDRVLRTFSNRTCYLFHAASGRIEELAAH